MRWACILGLSLVGCLPAGEERCADGSICPAGGRCVSFGCATGDQLAACDGLVSGAACTLAGVGAGRCVEGACVVALCGNARVEGEEVCDDGNLAGGDGCAPDCRSDEACGNAVLDFLAAEECDDADVQGGDGCSSRCLREVPAWQPKHLVPTGRIGAMVAADLARGVVYLFGGAGLGGGTSDLWAWRHGHWAPLDPGQVPPPRSHGGAAFDSRRGVLVIFGGRGGDVRLDDTWAWNGDRWSLVPGAVAPTARTGAAMTYDPVRDEIVLVGGETETGLADDAWRLADGVWSPLPVAPAARTEATLVAHPPTGRLLLLGGRVGDLPTVLPSLWWDGTAWTEGPASNGAVWMGAGFDRIGQRMIATSTETKATTWALEGDAWTPLPAPSPVGVACRLDGLPLVQICDSYLYGEQRSATWTGSAWLPYEAPLAMPPPTESPAMAYDPGRGAVVMFGGFDAVADAPRDETWEWDGAAWHLRTPTGARPPAVADHAMAFDFSSGEVLLFGGSQGASLDTWRWDGVRWLATTPEPSPSPRWDHALASEPTSGGVLLFGGDLGSGLSSETWRWRDGAWTLLSPTTAPARRTLASMTADPVRGRVVLFGGIRGIGSPEGGLQEITNETWEWDGADWSLRSPAGAPSPRWGAQLAFDPVLGASVLFGGDAAKQSRGDTWTWDGQAWRRQLPGDAPAPRQGAALVFDAARGEALLWGNHALAPNAQSDTWGFRVGHETDREACEGGRDRDGDGLVGCDDPDCWGRCTPTCAPRAAAAGACDPLAGPRCGDGLCSALENARLCPSDGCPVEARCGDTVCDPGETCPGDCAVPGP